MITEELKGITRQSLDVCNISVMFDAAAGLGLDKHSSSTLKYRIQYISFACIFDVIND
jgi:hypothetical protein